MPIKYTDQFDDYFDEEEEDLQNPGDMTAGRLTGSGGKKQFSPTCKYTVVNAAFIDAMAEFMLDEPDLIKQTFEEPLDYRNVSDLSDVFYRFIGYF